MEVSGYRAAFDGLMLVAIGLFWLIVGRRRCKSRVDAYPLAMFTGLITITGLIDFGRYEGWLDHTQRAILIGFYGGVWLVVFAIIMVRAFKASQDE